MKLHFQKLRLLKFITSAIYNTSMKAVFGEKHKNPSNMITYKLPGGIRSHQEKRPVLFPNHS